MWRKTKVTVHCTMRTVQQQNARMQQLFSKKPQIFFIVVGLLQTGMMAPIPLRRQAIELMVINHAMIGE